MLARLYGPLGLSPNSRPAELLSYRQYILLEAGHYLDHRERWAIVRGGMADGGYEEVYGLAPDRPGGTRAEYDRWRRRIEQECPSFFGNATLN